MLGVSTTSSTGLEFDDSDYINATYVLSFVLFFVLLSVVDILILFLVFFVQLFDCRFRSKCNGKKQQTLIFNEINLKRINYIM